MSFFFTTLIAAVPAAFLGYLCVMAFLLHTGKLGAVMMGITGITLLLCVAVLAMPVAVLLKGRSAKTVKASKSKAEAEDAAAEEASGDVVAEEEPIVAAEDGDVFVEGDADDFDDLEEK